MKKLIIAFHAAICSFCMLAATSAATIVGTGNDSSFLVIEAEAFGVPLEYEFRYNFDSENPLDGYDLLTAILAFDSERLQATFIGFANGYFLDSITFNGITLKAPADYAQYWVQWVSGGISGHENPKPIAAGTWQYGDGMSAPARLHTPGSTDGYIFNDGSTPPSVEPVPEPSSALLLFAGGMALLTVRRKAASRV
jgi:hypothetical protein